MINIYMMSIFVIILTFIIGRYYKYYKLKQKALSYVDNMKYYIDIPNLENNYKGIISLNIPKFSNPTGIIQITRSILDNKHIVIHTLKPLMLKLDYMYLKISDNVEFTPKILDELNMEYMANGNQKEIIDKLYNKYGQPHFWSKIEDDENVKWGLIHLSFTNKRLCLGGKMKNGIFHVDYIGTKPIDVAYMLC